MKLVLLKPQRMSENVKQIQENKATAGPVLGAVLVPLTRHRN